MPGPSSHSSASHRIDSRIPATMSSDDRSVSVSSIRRINVPPYRRANNQLNNAVRAPPTWRYPVGDGAKRTRGVIRQLYFRPPTSGLRPPTADLLEDFP